MSNVERFYAGAMASRAQKITSIDEYLRELKEKFNNDRGNPDYQKQAEPYVLLRRSLSAEQSLERGILRRANTLKQNKGRNRFNSY